MSLMEPHDTSTEPDADLLLTLCGNEPRIPRISQAGAHGSASTPQRDVSVLTEARMPTR